MSGKENLYIPRTGEVRAAVSRVLKTSATTPIPKTMHSLVMKEHPTWDISERRVAITLKNVMEDNGALDDGSLHSRGSRRSTSSRASSKRSSKSSRRRPSRSSSFNVPARGSEEAKRIMMEKAASAREVLSKRRAIAQIAIPMMVTVDSPPRISETKEAKTSGSKEAKTSPDDPKEVLAFFPQVQAKDEESHGSISSIETPDIPDKPRKVYSYKRVPGRGKEQQAADKTPQRSGGIRKVFKSLSIAKEQVADAVRDLSEEIVNPSTPATSIPSVPSPTASPAQTEQTPSVSDDNKTPASKPKPRKIYSYRKLSGTKEQLAAASSAATAETNHTTDTTPGVTATGSDSPAKSTQDSVSTGETVSLVSKQEEQVTRETATEELSSSDSGSDEEPKTSPSPDSLERVQPEQQNVEPMTTYKHEPTKIPSPNSVMVKNEFVLKDTVEKGDCEYSLTDSETVEMGDGSDSYQAPTNGVNGIDDKLLYADDNAGQLEQFKCEGCIIL